MITIISDVIEVAAARVEKWILEVSEDSKVNNLPFSCKTLSDIAQWRRCTCRLIFLSAGNEAAWRPEVTAPFDQRQAEFTAPPQVGPHPVLHRKVGFWGKKTKKQQQTSTRLDGKPGRIAGSSRTGSTTTGLDVLLRRRSEPQDRPGAGT